MSGHVHSNTPATQVSHCHLGCCRFINAKPTLEATQHQARLTDEWRRRLAVDGILARPAPLFGTLSQMLEFYVLGLSPEGHAVLLMKVGAKKQLTSSMTLQGGDTVWKIITGCMAASATRGAPSSSFALQSVDGTRGCVIQYNALCNGSFVLFMDPQHTVPSRRHASTPQPNRQVAALLGLLKVSKLKP